MELLEEVFKALKKKYSKSEQKPCKQ